MLIAAVVVVVIVVVVGVGRGSLTPMLGGPFNKGKARGGEVDVDGECDVFLILFGFCTPSGLALREFNLLALTTDGGGAGCPA